jgi:uncharacterized membrane protein YqiK
MLGKCLAMWTPGSLELIVVLIVWVLPILLVIWIIRSLIRNKRENQRLRLEVGKLADELQQIRKQMRNRQPDSSD